MPPCLAEFCLYGISCKTGKLVKWCTAAESPVEGSNERWLDQSERHICRVLLEEFNNNDSFSTGKRS